MAEYELPKRRWATAVTVAFFALIAAAIAALFIFAPKPDAPVASPSPVATQPVEPEAPAAPEEPAQPSEAPAPEPVDKPEETPATLVETLRDEYPGIAFFEGNWGDYTPASDDRVGQPGVYAGIVGVTGSGPKTVEFDGGTAVVTPGRFDGFKNTTELVIEVR